VAPAIGVRGSLTKLSGVDQLSLDTRGLDLSISKGFALLTPYAGIGRVWSTAIPKASRSCVARSSRSTRASSASGRSFW